MITYLISVGNFSHVIAGSMEAFMLVLNGEAELRSIVQDFLVPVLLGTALFAVISHAQVMKEI